MKASKHTWIVARTAVLVLVGCGTSRALGQGGLGGYGGLGGGRSGYAGPLDLLATPPTSSYGFGARAFDYGTSFPYSSYRLADPYVPGTGSFYGILLPLRDERARFRVHVPTPNAEVWLEGKKTAQTGLLRDFYSPPLEAGYRYTYRIRVRWLRDGKQVEQTRTINVRPNSQGEVDFTRPIS